MKYSAFTGTFLLILFAFSGIAAAQDAAPKTSGPYQAVEIGEFTIREGVEFTEAEANNLRNSLAKNFTRSRRVTHVLVADAASAEAPENVPARRLKITGEIVKYEKGSRAARYFIGFGVGKTKLIADVTVTDVETGEVLLNQTVDGIVSVGVFGGDSDDVRGGVASELIKTMTKKGLLGKKHKK